MNFQKFYFGAIAFLQEVLVGLGVGLLLILPSAWAFLPEFFTPTITTLFFTVSLASVFFVMAIRPLADIFTKAAWIRALVILRKGFGVLSASIIVGFFLGKIVADGFAFLGTLGTAAYWSLAGFALFAHLGDLTGIILLITSNKFSKRVLGPWWKRIQKLAYVYFYAGALYELAVFHSGFAAVAIIVVTTLVLLAFVKNRMRRLQMPAPAPQTV